MNPPTTVNTNSNNKKKVSLHSKNGGSTTTTPNPNSSTRRSRTVGKEKQGKERHVANNCEPTPPTQPVKDKTNAITLRPDLKNIMHAFGDSSEPHEESIRLMEIIIRQELGAFLFLCDTAAAMSGSKILGLKESIFTLRNEKVRLIKLFKYFATKDQQQKVMRINQINRPIHCKNYIGEIRSIIDNLDESGELGKLLEVENTSESAKTERALRADRIEQRLTIPKYITYAKARSVSFARKLEQLQEWVTTHLYSECRLSHTFMDVLAFLTYELVAQMVDLAFIVRRERLGHLNPIHRLCDPRGANPDTCMSAPAFQKKRKDDDCNSVSEILVQASEMEAKRLKKVTTTNAIPNIKSILCLSPTEVREAYIRFQSRHPLSQSYKSRAERLRHLGLKY